jgi:multiple sugar transport system substrate-binding protein
MTELRGITWDHTRGYVPLIATAQRFAELQPDISIQWHKRSLKEFGDLALDRLAQEFDLLVIDHPFVGMAAEHKLLTPLEPYISAAFLEGQAQHSVGKSNASYLYNGSQWALAIDTAAPISGWRSDLLANAGVSAPSTWSELLTLAHRGLVVIPGVPIDTLMHLYMLCIALGEEPFSKPNCFASHKVAIQALEMLRELAGLVSAECSQFNPIKVWELLAVSESVAYCPFAYGYSNYSRDGYAKQWLEVGGVISLDGHARFRTTLGGAGLAISSHCRHIESAAAYCQYVAGAECQRHLYFDSGGQPGHRSAWSNVEVNRRSHDFFRNTLETLDEAWLRPRWSGYHDLQNKAAKVVHQCVWGKQDPGDVVSTLNRLAAEMGHGDVMEERA